MRKDLGKKCKSCEQFPRERWVREEGRESKGWLKYQPKERERRGKKGKEGEKR